jgi:hypothetical protein
MHRMAKVATAMLFVVGCGQGTVVTTDFTDRQIFEGAIFGAGPVADLLPEARAQLRPELYARSTEELNAMAEDRATTIDALERNHPGLLSDFAEAARSGDPARVEAMLARTVEAISGIAADFPSAKSLNLPIDRRPLNLPVGNAKSLNLPIDRRPLNLPVGNGLSRPAWELLNSRLFSEQLSSSLAMTFGPRAVEH